MSLHKYTLARYLKCFLAMGYQQAARYPALILMEEALAVCESSQSQASHPAPLL
jgi:hypothetical protein